MGQDTLHLYKIFPHVVWFHEPEVTFTIYGSGLSANDSVYFTPSPNCSQPELYTIYNVDPSPIPGTSRVTVKLTDITSQAASLSVCYRVCDVVADNRKCVRPFTWMGKNFRRRVDIRSVSFGATLVRASKEHPVRITGARPGRDRATWVRDTEPCPLATAANATLPLVTDNSTVITNASSTHGEVWVACVLLENDDFSVRSSRMSHKVTAKELTYKTLSYMYPSHLFTGPLATDTRVYIEGEALRTGDMITIRSGPCHLPWGAGITPPQPNAVPISAADDGLSAWFNLTKVDHLDLSDMTVPLQTIHVCYGDELSDTRSGLYAEQTRINQAEWTLTDEEAHPLGAPRYPGLQLAGISPQLPGWAQPHDRVGGVSSSVAVNTFLGNFLNADARAEYIKISPGIVWEGIETEFTIGGPPGIRQYRFLEDTNLDYWDPAACPDNTFDGMTPPSNQIGRIKATFTTPNPLSSRLCGQCIRDSEPEGTASCNHPTDITVSVVGNSEAGAKVAPAVKAIPNPPHHIGLRKSGVVNFPMYIYVIDGLNNPVSHKWITWTLTDSCDDAIIGQHTDLDGMLTLTFKKAGVYKMCAKPAPRFGVALWDVDPLQFQKTAWSYLNDADKNYKGRKDACVWNVPGEVDNEILTTGNGTECNDMQILLQKIVNPDPNVVLDLLKPYHARFTSLRADTGAQVYRLPSHPKCMLFAEHDEEVEMVDTCFPSKLPGPVPDTIMLRKPSQSRNPDVFDDGRNSKTYLFPSITFEVRGDQTTRLWPVKAVAPDSPTFGDFAWVLQLKGLDDSRKWGIYFLDPGQNCRAFDPILYDYVASVDAVGGKQWGPLTKIGGTTIPVIGGTKKICLRQHGLAFDPLVFEDTAIGTLEGVTTKVLDSINLVNTQRLPDQTLSFVVAGLQYEYFIDGAVQPGDRIAIVPGGTPCASATPLAAGATQDYGYVKITVPRAETLVENGVHRFCYQPLAQVPEITAAPLTGALELMVIKPEGVPQKYVAWTLYQPLQPKLLVVDGINLQDDTISIVKVGEKCPIGTAITHRNNATTTYGMTLQDGVLAQSNGGGLHAKYTYLDLNQQWPNGPPTQSEDYKVCVYPTNLQYENLHVWDPEDHGLLDAFKLTLVILGKQPQMTRVPNAAPLTLNRTRVTISGTGLHADDRLALVPIEDGSCQRARFDELNAEMNYTATVGNPEFALGKTDHQVYAICYKPHFELRDARNEDWTYLSSDNWQVQTKPDTVDSNSFRFSHVLAAEEIQVGIGVASVQPGFPWDNRTYHMPGHDNRTTVIIGDEFKIINGQFDNCTKDFIEAPELAMFNIELNTSTASLTVPPGHYSLCYKPVYESGYPLLPVKKFYVPAVYSIAPVNIYAHAVTTITMTLTGAALQTGDDIQLSRGNCTDAEFGLLAPKTITATATYDVATFDLDEPVTTPGVWHVCIRANPTSVDYSLVPGVNVIVKHLTLSPNQVLQTGGTSDTGRIVVADGPFVSSFDSFFFSDGTDCTGAEAAPLLRTALLQLGVPYDNAGVHTTCVCVSNVGVDCTLPASWVEINDPLSTLTVVTSSDFRIPNVKYLLSNMPLRFEVEGPFQVGDKILLVAPTLGCTATSVPLSPDSEAEVVISPDGKAHATLEIPSQLGYGTGLVSICYQAVQGVGTTTEPTAILGISDIMVTEATGLTPGSLVADIHEEISITGAGLDGEDWISFVRDYYTDCSDAYMNAQPVQRITGDFQVDAIFGLGPGLYQLCYYHNKAGLGYTLYPHLRLAVKTFTAVEPRYVGIDMDGSAVKTFTLTAPPQLVGDGAPTTKDVVAIVEGEGCASLPTDTAVRNLTINAAGAYLVENVAFNFTYPAQDTTYSVCLDLEGSRYSADSGLDRFYPTHDTGLRIIFSNYSRVHSLTPRRVVALRPAQFLMEGTHLGYVQQPGDTFNDGDNLWLFHPTAAVGICSGPAPKTGITSAILQGTDRNREIANYPALAPGFYQPCIFLRSAKTPDQPVRPMQPLYEERGSDWSVLAVDFTEITPRFLDTRTALNPDIRSFTLTGTFFSDTDQVLFIPETTPDCTGVTPTTPGVETLTYVDDYKLTLQTNATLTAGVYRMCYRFKHSPTFFLYNTPKHTVTVRKILTIVPTTVLAARTGIGRTAVTITGVGLGPLDASGWIPYAPNTRYCDPSKLIEVVERTKTVMEPTLNATSPPTRYRLCWRFGPPTNLWDSTDLIVESEPPRIRAVTLSGIDAGGTIIHDPTKENRMVFVGTGMHHWDAVRWIVNPGIAAASSNSTTPVPANPCLDPNRNGTNTYLVWQGTADVHEYAMEAYAGDLLPGVQYFLCYYFAFSTGNGVPQYHPEVNITVVGRPRIVHSLYPRFPAPDTSATVTFSLTGVGFETGDTVGLVTDPSACSDATAVIPLDVKSPKEATFDFSLPSLVTRYLCAKLGPNPAIAVDKKLVIPQPGCTHTSNCPADQPYVCPSTCTCTANVTQCATSVSCHAGYVWCEESSYCAPTASACPLIGNKACPPEKPYRCPQGHCAENNYLCSPVTGCPLGSHRRCPDGSCHRVEEGCRLRNAPLFAVCPDGERVCPTGACLSVTQPCPSYHGCPLSEPFLCSDCQCASSIQECNAFINSTKPRDSENVGPGDYQCTRTGQRAVKPHQCLCLENTGPLRLGVHIPDGVPKVPAIRRRFVVRESAEATIAVLSHNNGEKIADLKIFEGSILNGQDSCHLEIFEVPESYVRARGATAVDAASAYMSPAIGMRLLNRAGEMCNLTSIAPADLQFSPAYIQTPPRTASTNVRCDNLGYPYSSGVRHEVLVLGSIWGCRLQVIEPIAMYRGKLASDFTPTPTFIPTRTPDPIGNTTDNSNTPTPSAGIKSVTLDMLLTTAIVLVSTLVTFTLSS